MPDASARLADDGGREVGPLVALPRLVAQPAAVEALQVDLLQGAVQNGQLVHVASAQGHCLERLKKDTWFNDNLIVLDLRFK